MSPRPVFELDRPPKADVAPEAVHARLLRFGKSGVPEPGAFIEERRSPGAPVVAGNDHVRRLATPRRQVPTPSETSFTETRWCSR